MNPCVFLDRDGVLNREIGGYAFRPEDFIIPEEVPGSLRLLKQGGYKLVVITNQAGISRGLFTREQMEACHAILNERTGSLLDGIYYSPWHPEVSESLSRKPDTLLFEKAIARFSIDTARSWMVGDAERDMIPAKKLGISTIFIGDPASYPSADAYAEDLAGAVKIILNR